MGRRGRRRRVGSGGSSLLLFLAMILLGWFGVGTLFLGPLKSRLQTERLPFQRVWRWLMSVLQALSLSQVSLSCLIFLSG